MDGDATEEDKCVRLLVRMGFDASASRAAFAAVNPVRELLRAASSAGERLARARSHELWLRVLAQADAALSAQSLMTVHLRDLALHAMIDGCLSADIMTAPNATLLVAPVIYTAWHQNPRLVAMSRRNLEVLGNRWRTGTLAALSVEEQLFFMSLSKTPVRGAGARLCAMSARDAVAFWPPDALDAAALRNVHDATCAMLEAEARGELFPGGLRGGRPDLEEGAAYTVLILCEDLFGDPVKKHKPQQNAQLVRDLGFSSAQKDAILELKMRIERDMIAGLDVDSQLATADASLKEFSNASAARAAAAEAKYGLQRCALPACAAQEPAARTYKRCSRCGTVYYCCAAHQQEDWKRHKHADGCKKPA
jgi:hypothetical protein